MTSKGQAKAGRTPDIKFSIRKKRHAFAAWATDLDVSRQNLIEAGVWETTGTSVPEYPPQGKGPVP